MLSIVLQGSERVDGSTRIWSYASIREPYSELDLLGVTLSNTILRNIIEM